MRVITKILLCICFISLLSPTIHSQDTATAYPVYLFTYKTNDMIHYYYTREATNDYGWKNEGVAFYAFLPYSNQEGTIPIYQLYKVSHGFQHYRLSANPNLEGWTSMGIFFTAYPKNSQVKGTTPVYRYSYPGEDESDLYYFSTAKTNDYGWINEESVFCAVASASGEKIEEPAEEYQYDAPVVIEKIVVDGKEYRIPHNNYTLTIEKPVSIYPIKWHYYVKNVSGEQQQKLAISGYNYYLTLNDQQDFKSPEKHPDFSQFEKGKYTQALYIEQEQGSSKDRQNLFSCNLEIVWQSFDIEMVKINEQNYQKQETVKIHQNPCIISSSGDAGLYPKKLTIKNFSGHDLHLGNVKGSFNDKIFYHSVMQENPAIVQKGYTDTFTFAPYRFNATTFSGEGTLKFEIQCYVYIHHYNIELIKTFEMPVKYVENVPDLAVEIAGIGQTPPTKNKIVLTPADATTIDRPGVYVFDIKYAITEYNKVLVPITTTTVAFDNKTVGTRDNHFKSPGINGIGGTIPVALPLKNGKLSAYTFGYPEDKSPLSKSLWESEVENNTDAVEIEFSPEFQNSPLYDLKITEVKLQDDDLKVTKDKLFLYTLQGKEQYVCQMLCKIEGKGTVSYDPYGMGGVWAHVVAYCNGKVVYDNPHVGIDHNQGTITSINGNRLVSMRIPLFDLLANPTVTVEIKNKDFSTKNNIYKVNLELENDYFSGRLITNSLLNIGNKKAHGSSGKTSFDLSLTDISKQSPVIDPSWKGEQRQVVILDKVHIPGYDLQTPVFDLSFEFFPEDSAFAEYSMSGFDLLINGQKVTTHFFRIPKINVRTLVVAPVPLRNNTGHLQVRMFGDVIDAKINMHGFNYSSLRFQESLKIGSFNKPKTVFWDNEVVFTPDDAIYITQNNVPFFRTYLNIKETLGLRAHGDVKISIKDAYTHYSNYKLYFTEVTAPVTLSPNAQTTTGQYDMYFFPLTSKDTKILSASIGPDSSPADQKQARIVLEGFPPYTPSDLCFTGDFVIGTHKIKGDSHSAKITLTPKDQYTQDEYGKPAFKIGFSFQEQEQGVNYGFENIIRVTEKRPEGDFRYDTQFHCNGVVKDQTVDIIYESYLDPRYPTNLEVFLDSGGGSDKYIGHIGELKETNNGLHLEINFEGFNYTTPPIATQIANDVKIKTDNNSTKLDQYPQLKGLAFSDVATISDVEFSELKVVSQPNENKTVFDSSNVRFAGKNWNITDATVTIDRNSDGQDVIVIESKLAWNIKPSYFGFPSSFDQLQLTNVSVIISSHEYKTSDGRDVFPGLNLYGTLVPINDLEYVLTEVFKLPVSNVDFHALYVAPESNSSEPESFIKATMYFQDAYLLSAVKEELDSDLGGVDLKINSFEIKYTHSLLTLTGDTIGYLPQQPELPFLVKTTIARGFKKKSNEAKAKGQKHPKVTVAGTLRINEASDLIFQTNQINAVQPGLDEGKLPTYLLSNLGSHIFLDYPFPNGKEKRSYSLAYQSTVDVIEEGKHWIISDLIHRKRYVVKNENGHINVYEPAWRNPFGLQGIEIIDLALEAEFVGPKIIGSGIAGNIKINKKDISIAVKVHKKRSHCALYANIPELSLRDIVSFVADTGQRAIPGSPQLSAQNFPNWNVKNVDISIAKEEFSIGELEFPAGLHFKINEINVLGISTSIGIAVIKLDPGSPYYGLTGEIDLNKNLSVGVMQVNNLKMIVETVDIYANMALNLDFKIWEYSKNIKLSFANDITWQSDPIDIDLKYTEMKNAIVKVSNTIEGSSLSVVSAKVHIGNAVFNIKELIANSNSITFHIEEVAFGDFAKMIYLPTLWPEFFKAKNVKITRYQNTESQPWDITATLDLFGQDVNISLDCYMVGKLIRSKEELGNTLESFVIKKGSTNLIKILPSGNNVTVKILLQPEKVSGFSSNSQKQYQEILKEIGKDINQHIKISGKLQLLESNMEAGIDFTPINVNVWGESKIFNSFNSELILRLSWEKYQQKNFDFEVTGQFTVVLKDLIENIFGSLNNEYATKVEKALSWVMQTVIKAKLESVSTKFSGNLQSLTNNPTANLSVHVNYQYKKFSTDKWKFSDWRDRSFGFDLDNFNLKNNSESDLARKVWDKFKDKTKSLW